MLSKTKSGKLVIVAAPGAYKVGQILTCGYDVAQFSANSAKAEVRVEGSGKSFQKTTDLGYYDDNRAGEQGYDLEGFRKTGNETKTLCYFYVTILRKIEPPKEAPKFFIMLGGKTLSVPENIKRAFNNNYRREWWAIKKLEEAL